VEEPPVQQTKEETLLAALLAANAELIEALKQYDDMERVAMERKAEDRSRKDVRMDPKVSPYIIFCKWFFTGLSLLATAIPRPG
jgi:hypothetical protein